MLIDDQGRVTEFQKWQVLERIAEERFNPVTKLASIICEVPIAFISVLDNDQERFLSRIGFDLLTQSVDKSICGAVILQDNVFIVPDISKDSRFSLLPAAIGKPDLRFYAGAPLRTKNHGKVGVLCVMDYKARRLSQDQEKSLETLAEYAVAKIEDEMIKDELKLAFIRLKTLIDSLNTGVILEDEYRNIEALSDTCSVLFNIPIQNVMGSNVFDFFNEIKSVFTQSEDFIRKAREYSEDETEFQGGELETIHGRYLEFSGKPIRVDEETRGFLWIFKDVTDEKESEKQIELQRAQLIISSKMAALGEVAAGIAHEINNPLTIIQSIGYILKNNSRESSQREKIVREAGERIEQTTVRISRIIKGLLQFAREAEPELKLEMSVQDMLDNTLSFVQERFQHYGIALRVTDFDPNLKIRCSPNAFSQILNNLLSNAFDAASSVAEKWVWIKVLDQEKFLKIEVWDSGPGVPEAIRGKIMQPFFTTKPIGKGSGLGLSVSKGLADEMGARLYFAPQYPSTCFVLEIPK